MKIVNKNFFVRYRFYIVSATIFTVWLSFFDRSNIVTQIQMKMNLRELESQKEFYINELQLIKKEENMVLGDKNSLEKFARERYIMKKEGETVFVIVDEDDKIIKE